MWFWFHPGWLFLIVPFLMMFVCVLLCVVMRRLCGGCRGACCNQDHDNERQHAARL